MLCENTLSQCKLCLEKYFASFDKYAATNIPNLKGINVQLKSVLNKLICNKCFIQEPKSTAAWL
jgi:hypothetical protein